MKSAKDKKNKIMAAFITLATVIVLGGITFTFFSASVSNANNEKINTQTATMRLVFSDNDNGVSGTLNLGESIVKKFTLENTGTVDAYGKINWVDLVNTYTSDSLTWTLEQSTTENGTYTSVGSGKVPTSTTETTAVLKNGLLVPVNTTYYYKLTITLNNLDINQSSDINANMHSKFNLQAGTKPGTDTIMELVAGEPSNTTDVITKTAPEGATCTNTLAYDGTNDNNLRYVGANPCNYVTFNGESPTTGTKWIMVNSETGFTGANDIYESQEACQTVYQGYGSPAGWECQSRTMTSGGWRIIGVMNNVDDGTGNQETRIKLVRNDSLGKYSWDTSSSNINGGWGVNDWTQADLKNELNGDYLDTSLTANTNWYNGDNNTQSATFDYTKRLSATAQSLIGAAKWHLGGFTSGSNGEDMIAATMYTKERGTTVYTGRPTEWTGKVALIYPSDYGFTTTGGTTTNRSSCIGTISTGDWWHDYSDCYLNNWISYQWVLSPYSDDSYSVFIAAVNSVSSVAAYSDRPVRPAVYLQSGVTISGGNGSVSEPYVLD